jgi:hypothetical protein
LWAFFLAKGTLPWLYCCRQIDYRDLPIKGDLMFSKFFGKDDKKAEPAAKDVPDSRGLEVVEDDPETVWSMWDDALAQQDSRFANISTVAALPVESAQVTTDVAPLSFEGYDDATQPIALEEKSLEQRMSDALQVVEAHHQRIANTIRTLWGYKECGVYINKLIMNGGDGMGHARIGFNQDAVIAMMALSNLHEAQYGAVETGILGFNDQSK